MSLLKKKKKTEYFIKINNGKTHDSFVSNLKSETIIAAQVWGLLSFRNTLSEDSVIYPKEKEQVVKN